LYYFTYFFLLVQKTQKTHWVGLFYKPGFFLTLIY